MANLNNTLNESNVEQNLFKYKLLYLLSMAFSMFAIFLQMIPLQTAPYFQSTLNIDLTDFIFYASLFFVSYSILQIPSGVLFDKYGLKVILPTFIILTSISVVIYWFSHTVWLIGFSRILAGIGTSVAYISGITIAAKYFSTKRLAFLIGLLEAVSTLGSIVATNPLNWLLTNIGWHYTGMIIIGFSIVLSGCALWLVMLIKPVNNNQVQYSWKETFLQIRLLLKNRRLLVVFLYSFFTWLIIMSFAGYWLKYYLISMHSYTEMMSLTLVEHYWTSFLVLGLVIGYFAHDYQKAKWAVLIVATIGFIAYALMCIPILFNYYGILCVVWMGGISATGVIVAFSFVPQYVRPELCGTAIALNNMFVVLGGYVGQIVFGAVVKHLSVNKYIHAFLISQGVEPSYYIALLIYLVAAFISLVCAIFIFRSKKN